mmetsp:Transcript_12042/g.36571  ORF Transcript_12042/g.36571 Transcript_12042/m.36571 type:complete len:366 (-) Transcript_12042:678-1775(-)
MFLVLPPVLPLSPLSRSPRRPFPSLLFLLVLPFLFPLPLPLLPLDLHLLLFLLLQRLLLLIPGKIGVLPNRVLIHNFQVLVHVIHRVMPPAVDLANAAVLVIREDVLWSLRVAVSVLRFLPSKPDVDHVMGLPQPKCEILLRLDLVGPLQGGSHRFLSEDLQEVPPANLAHEEFIDEAVERGHHVRASEGVLPGGRDVGIVLDRHRMEGHPQAAGVLGARPELGLVKFHLVTALLDLHEVVLHLIRVSTLRPDRVQVCQNVYGALHALLRWVEVCDPALPMDESIPCALLFEVEGIVQVLECQARGYLHVVDNRGRAAADLPLGLEFGELLVPFLLSVRNETQLQALPEACLLQGILLQKGYASL